MVMSRYQFLAELHTILRPEVYLEVGVQSGASLALAEHAGIAIGIDPDLGGFQRDFRRINQRLAEQTADDYFACPSCERPKPDLAFIDGSHLFEDALRDFINIEAHSHPHTLVAFDDVLPYNQAIAERVQPLGDWTGDVWKVIDILHRRRGDLTLTLVDVTPTGLLLVSGLDAGNTRLVDRYLEIVNIFRRDDTVPVEIICRSEAWDAQTYLDKLRAKTESMA